VVKNWMIW